jgi:Ca2+-binding RTX toxin-like protein
VAALADGGWVVTWASDGQDGSSGGVYGQRYTSGGVVSGPEFQVNAFTTGDQSNPSVTALSDGGWVVTWNSSEQDGSGYGIYSQRYSADGTALTTLPDLSIVGDDTAQLIVGGSGSDSLDGRAGNDTLNGGAGADTLIGGLGDDTCVVDNAGDVVTESSSAGTDTVRTSLSSYTLGGDVENLLYTGGGSLTASGNGLANSITGGSGNDTIDAGLGNDTLISGGGNDSLIGGGGNDAFTIDGSSLALGARVDGGTGTDSVTIAANSGSGFTVADLAAAITNVETIDFTQAGVNATLEFSANDVIAMTESTGTPATTNTLQVDKNAGDTITINPAAFTNSSTNGSTTTVTFYDNSNHDNEIAHLLIVGH